jgi:2,2-dialkylglycine decarboxylase (pyruvate)
MFDMQSTGRGAAIIVEPVISAGGVLVPPRPFMQALRRAADERGMLLIFDEAQTAFGRIGTRTGADYFDVVPDIMTMSKTLGGGLPFAAVATTEKIEEGCTKGTSPTIGATSPIRWVRKSGSPSSR